MKVNVERRVAVGIEALFSYNSPASQSAISKTNFFVIYGANEVDMGCGFSTEDNQKAAASEDEACEACDVCEVSDGSGRGGSGKDG